MIRTKLRMQDDAHQATFASRFNIGYGIQRLWHQLPILVDPDSSRTFSKDHAPIGRPDYRPGYLQITYDCFDFEAGLRLRGLFNLTGPAPWGRMTARQGKQSYQTQ